MGRAPCCSKVGLNRGPWTAKEDALLIKYIEAHGEGQWRSMPKKAGLLRCGKSCRLRWKNYLRPDIKRGNITQEEDDLIIRLHGLLGNKWSLIAGRLPGRTDNEIKNYWNTHLSKRLRSQGTDPNTHKKLSESELEKLAKRRKKKKCRSLVINNNNHTNKKMNFEELSEVTIRDNDMSMDNNNNVRTESLGDRTNVHLSKPKTVNSVISVTRGNSNASLETITSGSSSHHGLITSYDSENNIIFDMSWVSNNAYMEHNGLDDHLIMTMGSPYGNNDVVTEPDTNQQFEKLYEEYLQLIKVDHHDPCYYINENNGVHGVGETQLDTFTKSFLI